MKNLPLSLLSLLFIFSCSENDSYSARVLNADTENESWLLHGRTYDESRFSPLKDINDSNVNNVNGNNYLTYEYNDEKEMNGADVFDGVQGSSESNESYLDLRSIDELKNVAI